MTKRKIIIVKAGSQDLNEAVLALTSAFKGAFKLCQVLIHFSAAVTETASVTLDHPDGAEYDTVLDSTNITAGQNYVFRPTGDCIVPVGGQIKVGCTNATATAIAYATIIAEDLGK